MSGSLRFVPVSFHIGTGASLSPHHPSTLWHNEEERGAATAMFRRVGIDCLFMIYVRVSPCLTMPEPGAAGGSWRRWKRQGTTLRLAAVRTQSIYAVYTLPIKTCLRYIYHQMMIHQRKGVRCTCRCPVGTCHSEACLATGNRKSSCALRSLDERAHISLDRDRSVCQDTRDCNEKKLISIQQSTLKCD